MFSSTITIFAEWFIHTAPSLIHRSIARSVVPRLWVSVWVNFALDVIAIVFLAALAANSFIFEYARANASANEDVVNLYSSLSEAIKPTSPPPTNDIPFVPARSASNSFKSLPSFSIALTRTSKVSLTVALPFKITCSLVTAGVAPAAGTNSSELA